jgi:nitrogen fixation NifU-like protein
MERSALDSVYQELILKHYRSSKFRGELEAPDAVVPMRNPVCGDDILLQVQVREGRIEAIRFSGHGCAISARFREMIHGDETAARDKALGDMRALSGVARLPRRVKCAMLGWDALEEAEKKLAAE